MSWPYVELRFHVGFPWWLSGKESACQCQRLRRHGFDAWVRKIPWRRKWQSNPILEWKGSLVDYSPWICKRVRHDWTTNVNLYSKGELKLQMELSLSISWHWNREMMLFYLCGPSIITRILKHAKRKQKSQWKWCSVGKTQLAIFCFDWKEGTSPGK